jgi:hypothetical protein
MISNSSRITVRTLACTAVAVTFLTITVNAADFAESTVGHGLGFAYDSAHETVLVGTVKGFASRPAAAGPVGLHLLVVSGVKTLDVHLGTYISRETQQLLRPGQLVQVVGVNENVGGKEILLARQLVFQGRLVTIRNARGFLVRDLDSPHTVRNGKSAGNGGIQ